MRLLVAPIPSKGDLIDLDAEQSHHLIHVMRIAINTEVVVFDGEGNEVQGVFTGIHQKTAQIQITSTPISQTPAHPRHILIGIPKGPAMDRAVRMATEAGATHIHPVFTTYTSVNAGIRATRWRRIATASAKQCGRADVPHISEPRPLIKGIEALPEGLHRLIAVVGISQSVESTQGVAILIGPEGGFSSAEIQACEQLGFTPVGLGRWTLRTDTAVAVALARCTLAEFK